jgi:Fe-S-cluster containining protein
MIETGCHMNDDFFRTGDFEQSCIEPIVDDRLRFACHPGVPCFTECCADLNLALTPYDVLRLKDSLKISSAEFLDQYTTDEVRYNCGLPVLMLKMTHDSRGTCPFLQPEGCTVYEDRPGACRLYPIARAAKHERGTVKERFFLMREPHCCGFQEEKEWSTEAWLEDQGLESYNEMNSLWMAMNQGISRDTPPSITGEKLRMYFMACYNLDMFKRFVLESRLLKLYQVDRRTVAGIKTDQVELLKLAFKWVAFSIFGKKTMKLTAAAMRSAKKRR